MKHEFKVLLDGVELPEGHEQTMETAIQRAALHELAGIDLRGDLVAVLRPRDGGTRGIVFVPTDPLDSLGDRRSAAFETFG
jgi:hypothetical protein